MWYVTASVVTHTRTHTHTHTYTHIRTHIHSQNDYPNPRACTEGLRLQDIVFHAHMVKAHMNNTCTCK